MSVDVRLDISTKCTAKCIYCMHQRRNMVKPVLIDRQDALEIIDIVTTEKFRQVGLFYSGEPFLHPDVYEFMVAVAKGGAEPYLLSKFHIDVDFAKLEKAMIECNKFHKPVRLLLTVDSFDQDVLDKTCFGVKADKLLSNFGKLAEIRKRIPFNISFNIIVTRLNEQDKHNIKKRILSFGFSPCYFIAMAYYLSRYATKEEVRNIAAIIPHDHVYQRVKVKDGKITGSIKAPCRYFKYVIGPTGNLTICCHDMTYEINTGNVLKTKSLRKILESDKYKTIAALGKQRKLHICEGCN